MKSFLWLLVVALIGLVFWVRHISTRPTETHREIIAGLREELKTAIDEQDRLRSELALAKAAVPDTAPKSPVFDSLPPEGTTTTTASPATRIDHRLSELKAIYDKNVTTLNREHEEAERSLSDVEARRKFLQDSPMNFSEQSVQTDPDGAITGNRGVRTSQADRDRAIKVRNEELEALAEEVKAASAHLANTVEKKRLLDRQYEEAIKRTRLGSTGSGRGLDPVDSARLTPGSPSRRGHARR